MPKRNGNQNPDDRSGHEPLAQNVSPVGDVCQSGGVHVSRSTGRCLRPLHVDGLFGFQIGTLRAHSLELGESEIEERVQQLNDMRVVQMTSLRTILKTSSARLA